MFNQVVAVAANWISNDSRKKNRHLTWRLVRFVVISSAIFTCLATAIQLYVNFNKEKSSVYRILDDIEYIYIETLQKSIWAFDTPMINVQLDTIIKTPDIIRVTLRYDRFVIEREGDLANQTLETNVHHSYTQVERQYSLVRQQGAKQKEIGNLTVTASLDRVYQNIKDQIIVILLTNAVKSFLVAMIIFLGFQKMVTLRITKFSNFMEGYKSDWHEKVPMYHENRGVNRLKDEIDVLIDKFNALNMQVSESMEEIKKNQQLLSKEKRELSATLMSIDDAVIMMNNEGIIQNINPAFESLFKCNKSVELGRNISEFFHSQGIKDGATSLFTSTSDAWVPIEGKKVITFQPETSKKAISLEIWCRPIFDHQKQYGFVAVLRDITESVELYEEVKYRATHDRLTTLCNRHEFEIRFANMLKGKERYGHHHVLLYLDLDRFKIINDTCGHYAGDQVLTSVAQEFKKFLRDRDTLARLGGDEFAIILEQCPVEVALNTANGIIKNLSQQHFTFDNIVFKIGVSIGLLLIDEQISTVDEALMKADESCYQAKLLGRNRVHIYSQDQKILQRTIDSTWAARITQALIENRIKLFVQPISATQTVHNILHSSSAYQQCPNQRVQHFEVLIRIEHEGELYLPNEFFPAAERYALSQSIDQWVVKHMFAFVGEQCKLKSNTAYSINLTAHSLSNDQFVEYILEQQQLHNTPSSAIIFELTESTACENVDRTRLFIETLKEKGFKFSLDDFGCGFSSYQYLKELPVDYIKIDGSFIRNLGNSSIDFSIVRSIFEVANSMGKSTVAEYVESEAIYDKLVDIGIEYVQGYIIGRPIPLLAAYSGFS